jgi:hypothetical protein
MVLTLDGDYPQIETILNNFVEAHTSIAFWKFAGACSLSMQPNDLIKSFMLLHRAVKKLNYAPDAVLPSYVVPVVNLFRKVNMDLPSVKAFIIFFSNIFELESKAFSGSVLREGWKISGIVPFNAEQMLNMDGNIFRKAKRYC